MASSKFSVLARLTRPSAEAAAPSEDISTTPRSVLGRLLGERRVVVKAGIMMNLYLSDRRAILLGRLHCGLTFRHLLFVAMQAAAL